MFPGLFDCKYAIIISKTLLTLKQTVYSLIRRRVLSDQGLPCLQVLLFMMRRWILMGYVNLKPSATLNATPVKSYSNR